MLNGKVMLNSVQMQMQMQICESSDETACPTYHWLFLSRIGETRMVSRIVTSRTETSPLRPQTNLTPARVATIKVAGVMQKSSEILHSMNKCVRTAMPTMHALLPFAVHVVPTAAVAGPQNQKIRVV